MSAETFNDWLRFQRFAERNGYDKLEFMAMFPGGPRKCRWLDAYMGLVLIDGEDGFVTVNQLDEMVPGVTCVVLGEVAEDA